MSLISRMWWEGEGPSEEEGAEEVTVEEAADDVAVTEPAIWADFAGGRRRGGLKG